MADSATLSPPILVLSTKVRSYRSFPPRLKCPHQTRCLHFQTRRTGCPRTDICQSKLNGSTEEEREQLEQAFFDGNEEMEDDEAENSVDLLLRFFQSMFKKVSKRAKMATHSVLPMPLSPQLVSFAVDGVLLLTTLSIVKALLEVVCTLGGTVFIVILVLRVIWAAVSHFQPSGNNFNHGRTSHGTAQPAT